MSNLRKAIMTTFIILFAILSVTFMLLAISNGNIDALKSDDISDDFVTFLDVGQGDCSVISSNGKNFLVDTGDGNNSDEIVKSLKHRGIKNIDVLSISHYHDDHTGGIDDILSVFKISNYIFPKTLSDTKVSNEIIEANSTAIKNKTKTFVAKQGMTAGVGDFDITFLYSNVDLSGENNHSVYMMAQIEDVKFLFTGDGEQPEENKLVNEGLDIDCDVLKVPHHGGSSSSSMEFIDACSPSYAAISCGADNMYGHPHDETVNRLKKANCEIYRTDKNGDITFYIKEGKIFVKTEK